MDKVEIHDVSFEWIDSVLPHVKITRNPAFILDQAPIVSPIVGQIVYEKPRKLYFPAVKTVRNKWFRKGTREEYGFVKCWKDRQDSPKAHWVYQSWKDFQSDVAMYLSFKHPMLLTK